MDSDRFDALARTLSSRRTALGGLLGGSVAALLGLALPEEADAHNFLARCHKIQDASRRAACLRRARAHKRWHRQHPPCVPRPPATICASVGRCSGVAADNCGRLINCTCPPGHTCRSNGSCGLICTGFDCPSGCTCGPRAEGSPWCIKEDQPCSQVPQSCTSSDGCPVGWHCQPTGCGPGGAVVNRCVQLCPS